MSVQFFTRFWITRRRAVLLAFLRCFFWLLNSASTRLFNWIPSTCRFPNEFLNASLESAWTWIFFVFLWKRRVDAPFSTYSLIFVRRARWRNIFGAPEFSTEFRNDSLSNERAGAKYLNSLPQILRRCGVSIEFLNISFLKTARRRALSLEFPNTSFG